MKRKTIFPKSFFSSQKELKPTHEKIGEQLPFWKFVAKKSQISDKETVFCFFTLLPTNTVIYQWFLKDSPIEMLYNYVSYQTDIEESKIRFLGIDQKTIKTLADLDYNQALRRRYEFTVIFEKP